MLHFKRHSSKVNGWFGGYKWSKHKGNLVPSEANVAKKHHYLRTFLANREKPPAERLREVYHRDEDSL
jgi:hypothetical protein